MLSTVQLVLKTLIPLCNEKNGKYQAIIWEYYAFITAFGPLSTQTLSKVLLKQEVMQHCGEISLCLRFLKHVAGIKFKNNIGYIIVVLFSVKYMLRNYV